MGDRRLKDFFNRNSYFYRFFVRSLSQQRPDKGELSYVKYNSFL